MGNPPCPFGQPVASLPAAPLPVPRRATSFHKESPMKSYGCEDTMHLALTVKWHQPDRLFGKLELAREAAQTDGTAETYFQDFTCAVKKHGIKTQDGPFYRFVVMYEGLMIAIMQTAAANSTLRNVLIRAGSEYMTIKGTHGLRQDIDTAIKFMNGAIEIENVSRADYALDCLGLPTETFRAYAEKSHWITRARTSSDFDITSRFTRHSRFSGFSIGRSIILRVYDKLLEIGMKHPARLEMFKTHKWENEEPDHVTRIEFQFRRDTLKEWNVSTLETWEEHRRSLILHHCRNWFRLAPLNMKKQSARANNQTAEVWEIIQSGFEQALEIPQAKSHATATPPNMEALADQIIGCALAIWIKTNKRDDSIDAMDAFVKVLCSQVEERFNVRKETIQKRFMAKMMAQHHATPTDTQEEGEVFALENDA